MSKHESWRCFHCGENFTDRHQAELHFGRSWQITQPMCTLDAEYVRKLERQLDAWNNEDTELHKQIHAINAEMQVKIQRAEEDGYARGLRDAKLHPEELGLQPVANKLQLEVGKWYVSGDGVLVYIFQQTDAVMYPFTGDLHYKDGTKYRTTFTPDGCAVYGMCYLDIDLVREATEEEIAAIKS